MEGEVIKQAKQTELKTMGPRKSQNYIIKELKENRLIYLMALPGIIVLFLFCYIPFSYIIVAFKNFNIQDGIFGSPWVGLGNFKFFFSSGKALQITFNTVYLNILFIIFDLVIQVSIAVLINEIRNKYFKSISQSVFFFPYFLSWVVIGEIIYNLFSSDLGAINSFLATIGISGIQWYKHPEFWRAILVGAHVWKFTGYGTIVYLAMIAGFDSSIYEAATVDGATRFQCIRYITIPMLKGTMIVLVLFSIGRIFFGDFGMVYSIVRDVGPLLKKTEIIDTYVYRALRQTGDFSMATAIGIYQSIMGLIIILVCNKLAKRINDGSGLF
jgi:putative aldouronate transport system permease protein